jgi:hypothetical protein
MGKALSGMPQSYSYANKTISVVPKPYSYAKSLLCFAKIRTYQTACCAEITD